MGKDIPLEIESSQKVYEEAIAGGATHEEAMKRSTDYLGSLSGGKSPEQEAEELAEFERSLAEEG